MTDNNPVYIISDSPEKESNLFGFDAYAKTIAELIAYKENKTPLVIGIYGQWGSGKTTLMETVISRLEKIEKYEDRSHYRDCKTVWFQAWKYKEEDEILAALIEEIFKTMKNKGFFEECKAEIKELTKKVNKGKVAGAVSKLLSGGLVDISGFFSGLEHKEKLGFYDTFQIFFDDLLRTYLKWQPKICAGEMADEKKGVLVVFIDDLDRCPELKILKVLETIKLFMDKKGCIFVIGAANEIIENALKRRYGNEDAAKFMDKIVQVTFNLPQIPLEDFETFVKKISPDIQEAVLPHLHLIVPSIKGNPRKLKRFLNNLNLQQGLLNNKGIQVQYNHLLYWNIIDYGCPSLRDDIRDHRPTLDILKKIIQDIDAKPGGKEDWGITDEMLKEVPQQSLHVYLRDKELVNILRNFDITPEQLNQIITLTEVVGSVEEDREREEREERTDFAKIAETPMVEVPDGEFLYGDDKRKENIEKPFLIDVYPVTNSRYQQFIKAGGYSNNDYWSEEGRKWRKGKNITQQKFWDDEELNQPNCPVVGVTYYEAEAYAKWAGKRLPTEKEWEKAARDTDGSKYPWGDKFETEKCNTEESGIRRTTKVTRYPNGISHYGCYDMAGNAWEWTESDYKGEKGVNKVLRGGSWFSYSYDARCAGRNWHLPDSLSSYVGFRCARTLKK